MVAIAKSVRRAMIDRLQDALLDCSDESDGLPTLIVAKYGHRKIGTSLSRLSGNCEVTYDFASQEFPGEGRWETITDLRGRTIRHYHGEAELYRVLPYMYGDSETVYPERPIYYPEPEWDGYEYSPVVNYYEPDTDRDPEQEGNQWHGYRQEIALAISAVVVSLICAQADSPPVRSWDTESWFRAELEKPSPERRVMSAGEWLRGFNGVASWKGYPGRAAVGILLPWELGDRHAPPSARNPFPPNHRECLGALPIAGHYSRDSHGGYHNSRYQGISDAFYTLRDRLDNAGEYNTPAFNAVIAMHYRFLDRIADDRAALLFLRSHGVTV